MSNSLSAFSPALMAPEILFQAEKNLVFADILRKNYSGVAQAGASVSVPYFASITGDTRTIGDSVTVSDMTGAVKTITMNKQAYKVIKIEDMEQLQASPDLIATYSEQIGKAVASAIDTDIATLITSIPTGQAVTYASGSVDANLLDAIKLLDDANAPSNDRFAIVNPTFKRYLMSNSSFLGADKLGDADMIRRGLIGELFGVKIFATSLLSSTNVVFHKDWAAYVAQGEFNVRVESRIESLCSYLGAHTVYGYGILQSGFAVKIS